MQENDPPQTNGVVQKQAPKEAAGGKSKLPRHSRWTMQDTIILIQGKLVVENHGSIGQGINSDFRLNPFEPKWDAVSSFCRQHGVERGPVQCRKRWGNLVCDFRKVKTWELQVREEVESFWEMQRDSRRDKKLPGFFDREIYDLLDGGEIAATAYPLSAVREDLEDGDEDGYEEKQPESDFGNKTLTLEGNGWCLESGGSAHKETDPAVAAKEKHPGAGSCGEPISRDGKKRKKISLNGYENTSLKKLLIKVLEKNFTMMNAQLEAQFMNTELDREQKKNQDGNLVDAFTKIADALGKIADKL